MVSLYCARNETSSIRNTVVFPQSDVPEKKILTVWPRYWLRSATTSLYEDLSRFDRVTTVPSTVPFVLRTVTVSLSYWLPVVVSLVLILSQKRRTAPLKLDGMVTVWY